MQYCFSQKLSGRTSTERNNMKMWNSLSANLRSASVSLQTFVMRLKAYLFRLPSAQLKTVFCAVEMDALLAYYYYY